MNSESKAKCYSTIYASLKKETEVTNLGFPPQEKRKHYDLFFDVGGLHVDYRLRRDSDLLLIRVSRDIPDWINETDAREFCKNELRSTKYRWYAEKGKLSGSYTLPLSGLSEENAQKEANRGAEDFIQYLIENKDKITSFFEKPVLVVPDILEKEDPFDDLHTNTSEEKEVPMIPVPEMELPPSEHFAEKEGAKEHPVTEEDGENHIVAEDKEMDPPVIPSDQKKPKELPNKGSADTSKKEKMQTEKDIRKSAEPIPNTHSSQSMSDILQPGIFHKERADFEKFCSSQITDIERRQQLVKKMEAAVDDKIEEYQKKNDDLVRQKAEVLAMKEKNEKDSADIAERIALTQELQNKEQMIVILQENIEAKDKEMKRGSFFSGILSETDAVNREEHETYVKALRDSEQTVQDLQSEVSRLISENNKIRQLYDGMQSAAEKEKVEQEKWEDQVKRMEQQLSDAKNKASDLEVRLEQARMETVKPVDIEDFEDAGFSIREMVGEQEGLYELHGAPDIPDGLTVVIDTLHRFALLQKELRRGKKHMRTIHDWNTSDLNSSYSLYNNLLIVKKYLYSDDTVSDLKEVIKRVEPLR